MANLPIRCVFNTYFNKLLLQYTLYTFPPYGAPVSPARTHIKISVYIQIPSFSRYYPTACANLLLPIKWSLNEKLIHYACVTTTVKAQASGLIIYQIHLTRGRFYRLKKSTIHGPRGISWFHRHSSFHLEVMSL